MTRVSITQKEAISSPEKEYWADKAALLDPRAYSYAIVSSISATVPVGETWYALNLWHIKNGDNQLFQRTLDVNKALVLPAGTILAANGSQTAYYYICKPKSVFDIDTRYTTDPKGLYYTRLNKLRTVTQYDLTITIPAGSAPGTIVSASFPT